MSRPRNKKSPPDRTPRLSKSHQPAPTFGEINVGPIRTVPIALREAGVDPARVLRSVELDPGFLDDERNRLPFPSGGRLLQACVEATGQPHFGLLASRHFELAMLGPLGYLMRNETTVRSALRAFRMNLHLHDRGASVGLVSVDSRRCALSYAVFAPSTPGLDIIYDFSLMIGMRMLKTLCGPRWRPQEVRLARAAPRDPSPYRRAFEAPVVFNAPLSTLVFESRWLDAAVQGADPGLHRLLTVLLEALGSATPRSLTDRIRLALGTSVLAGTANSAHIAELFSLSQRSLRRSLAQEGVTLKQLTAEARQIVAQQLLTQTDMPVSDVAAALHYSDPTALSRAFRRWAGQSPQRWRLAQTALTKAGRK